MACIEHPESLIVTAEDIKSAITITDKFAECYHIFIESSPHDESDSLYNYLQQNKGRWITKKELKDKKFVSWQNFPKWLPEQIEYLKETFSDEGLTLLEAKYNRNTGIKYMLVEQGQEYTATLSEKIEQMDQIIHNYEDTSVKISMSKDMTKRYELNECYLRDLDPIIKMPKEHYSAIEFKHGYRKAENFIGEPNLIILDFDEGLELTKAKEIFKPFINCIATTKSHRAEKNGNINDRFRVILPTHLIPKDKFKDVMASVIDFFGADKACKDLARFYYSNENAEICFNNGIMFDWKPFIETKEAKKSKIVKKHSDEGELEDSNTGDHTLLSLIGTDKAFEAYKKCGINFEAGKRNESFFRLASWFRNKSIPLDKAIEELWRIYTQESIDTTDFPESELENLIRNVFKEDSKI